MGCSDMEISHDDIKCVSIDFMTRHMRIRYRIPRKLKRTIKGRVTRSFSKRMRIECFDAPFGAKGKYIFRSYYVE